MRKLLLYLFILCLALPVEMAFAGPASEVKSETVMFKKKPKKPKKGKKRKKSKRRKPQV